MDGKLTWMIAGRTMTSTAAAGQGPRMAEEAGAVRSTRVPAGKANHV